MGDWCHLDWGDLYGSSGEEGVAGEDSGRLVAALEGRCGRGNDGDLRMFLRRRGVLGSQGIPLGGSIGSGRGGAPCTNGSKEGGCMGDGCWGGSTQ